MKGIKGFALSLVFCFSPILSNGQNSSSKIDSLEQSCSIAIALDSAFPSRASCLLTAESINELLIALEQEYGTDNALYDKWFIKKADCLYKGEMYDQSLTLLNESLKRTRPDTTAADILFKIATCHLRLNQLSQMESAFQQWNQVVERMSKSAPEQAIKYLTYEYNLLENIQSTKPYELLRIFEKRDSILRTLPKFSYDRLSFFLEDYPLFDVPTLPDSIIRDIDALSKDESVEGEVRCLANLFLIGIVLKNASTVSAGGDESYYKSLLTRCLEYYRKANKEYLCLVNNKPSVFEDNNSLHIESTPKRQYCYKKLLEFASHLAYAASLIHDNRLSDSIIDNYILTKVSASRLSINSDYNELLSFLNEEHLLNRIKFEAYESKLLNMLEGGYCTASQESSILDSLAVVTRPDFDYIQKLLPRMSSKDRQVYLSEYRDVIKQSSTVVKYAQYLNLTQRRYFQNAFDIISFFKGILIDYDKFGQLPEKGILFDDVLPSLNGAILMYFIEDGDWLASIAYDPLTDQFYYHDIFDASSFAEIWPSEFSGRSIYFIPDGSLTLKNIENYSNEYGVFAYQAFDLHRITSARELVISNQSSSTVITSAILYGGLIYDSLQYLPGSAKEISQISSIIGEEKCQIVTGGDATKQSVKYLSGKEPSLLHFASHAFSVTDNLFDSEAPRYGIYLSGSDYISDYEISKLDLSGVDLVVLSACDSASGIVSWEGVTGLQRAFKLSGVQSIIMAVGKVNDTASQFFMRQLYTSLSKSGDRRASYYEAIEATRKQFHGDSYYWAPFILLD